GSSISGVIYAQESPPVLGGDVPRHLASFPETPPSRDGGGRRTVRGWGSDERGTQGREKPRARGGRGEGPRRRGRGGGPGQLAYGRLAGLLLFPGGRCGHLSRGPPHGRVHRGGRGGRTR